MQRTFSRVYLATHAPSFARHLDAWEVNKSFPIKYGTLAEKSMLSFLEKHGFDRAKIEAEGFGFSHREDGGVTIEA